VRRQEEFFCEGGCHKYFKTYLRSNMFGNYTIMCPACNHHHFRVIKEGLVTDIRHNESMGESEIIVGLKSTVSDTPWHNDKSFLKQQLRVYQGGRGSQND